MANYTDVFGSQTLPPSSQSYTAISLTANATTFWPYNYTGTGIVLAKINDIASTGAYSITIPSAEIVSPGQDILFKNNSAFLITILDAAGGTLGTIAAGAVKYFYLTDNSTVAGTWNLFTFGTGTSAADASALAGMGTLATGATLSTNTPMTVTSYNATLTTANRAEGIVFNGGSVTCALPAVATAGNGFYFDVKNGGTGTVTIATVNSELIDGVVTLGLNPLESCRVECSGSAWYTVGLGRSMIYQFTKLVKDLTGLSAYTMTSSDVSNKLLQFTGAPSGAVTITMPPVVAVYYIEMSTSNAYSATFTSGAATVTLAVGARAILYCDGVNIVSAQTANIPAAQVVIQDDISNAASVYPTWVLNTSGNQTLYGSSPDLYYVPSTGIYTAKGFAGKLNGLTVTSSTGTLTIAAGKTLTQNFSGTYAGTDGTTMTFPATNATLARTDAAQTFTGTQTFGSTIVGSINGNAATVTTNANLTGPITSVGNATAVANQTGTGSTFVMSASPTITGTLTATLTGTATGLAGTPNISVGTVTASTGAFTTLSASGNATVGTLSTISGTEGLPATTGTAFVGSFRVRTAFNSPILDFGNVNSSGSAWLQATDATAASVHYSLLLNPNGGSVELAGGKVVASSTGLAVTGTLSATGFSKLGTTADVHGLAVGSQNGGYALSLGSVAGGYGRIGYNMDFQASGMKYFTTDTASWVDFANGNVDTYCAAANTAGATLTGTKITSVTSTGLAVTGALTVTKASGLSSFLSGGSGNYAAIALGRTAAEAALWISGGPNQVITGDVAGDLVITNASGKILLAAGAGSPWATFSSTGLAVTGAISATGSANFGMNTTNATAYFNNGAQTTIGPAPSIWIGARGNSNDLAQIGFGYISGQTNPAVVIAHQQTNVAGNCCGDLLFATRSVTTDTAPIERMRLTAAGWLLVGVSVQRGQLTVQGGTGTIVGSFQSNDASATYSQFVYNGVNQIGTITGSTTAISYNTSSDYRLKNNPAALTDSGAFIDALLPKTWEWAQDRSKGAGFIAHEFALVSPSSVSGDKDAVDPDGKPIYQAMQASSPEVMANIVAEIQSLRRRAATLEASIH